MWRNRSLIYPVIIFLLLAIGGTLVVGYTVNYAILEDVLQERMSRQARQISNDIIQALEKKVQHLERFKESWMANVSWSQDAENDPRLGSKGGDDSLDAMWKQLSTLLPLWGVDFILFLDPEGQITHRMPANFAADHPFPKPLLEQVHQEMGANQAIWHVAQVAGGWRMMLFSPIKGNAQERPRVVVFGQGLDKVVNQIHQGKPEQFFLFASADGIAAGSPNSLAGAQFHQEIAAMTIGQKTPQMAFDSSLPTNLYYAPFSLLDQTFSLVVPVSLDEVRQLLTNSRKRLTLSIVMIVILLVVLGVAMERIILHPLRRLRQKAAVMVQACSGNEALLYFNPEEHGNEIVMLERAMEEASIKLYAHVDHLVNTKNLLEGLSLKDPITLLGNRRMLEEFLARTLGQCKRKERKVAVILVEPTPLPLTNEEQDQIRRQLAERLRDHLRGEDLAFRINANEFVAFTPECGDEEQVLALVHRLYGFLTTPYQLEDGHIHTLPIHLGVAVFPVAGERVDTLLDNARAALIEAHKGGRYPFAIYNYAMDED